LELSRSKQDKLLINLLLEEESIKHLNAKRILTKINLTELAIKKIQPNYVLTINQNIVDNF
jgi:hypothetical protein